MKFKCIYDEDGLFRFTKEELIKVVDESYEEGYADAKNAHNFFSLWYLISLCITTGIVVMFIIFR